MGPFEICFCHRPLLQFFSFAATCFPFLLNPTAFPAGPGLHGVPFPSLKACMLRSSCAGDLPATLFISSINRFCFLLRIVYLSVCCRSLFFFFNLVGSSYYLFVRATNCFGRCGHKHTIISWISCFFVTHTQGVVMLEDGDLKQNKERLSRTFSSSVLLLFVLLSFKIFHRVTQLFLLLSLKTAVCLCHSRKKKVVGKEQWELVLVHYALAIIIITIFRC